MLTKVFLLAIFSGLTLTLSGPIRHPYAKAIVSLLCGCLLTSLCYIDIRLAIIPTLVGGYFVVTRRTIPGYVTGSLLLVAWLFVAFTPHGDAMLYFATRYTDNFSYLTDGSYYAEDLGEAVSYDRRYGDTYQSKLYADYILRSSIASLPHGTEVVRASVEEVQTWRVFSSVLEFCDATNPVVHLTVIPPDDELRWEKFDPANLPYQTVLEVTI